MITPFKDIKGVRIQIDDWVIYNKNPYRVRVNYFDDSLGIGELIIFNQKEKHLLKDVYDKCVVINEAIALDLLEAHGYL